MYYWNGDRTTIVDIFRQSNGNWHLHTTKSGVVDKVFKFGTSGNIPVAADWDVDGASDIDVFRPANGDGGIPTKIIL